MYVCSVRSEHYAASLLRRKTGHAQAQECVAATAPYSYKFSEIFYIASVHIVRQFQKSQIVLIVSWDEIVAGWDERQGNEYKCVAQHKKYIATPSEFLRVPIMRWYEFVGNGYRLAAQAQT